MSREKITGSNNCINNSFFLICFCLCNKFCFRIHKAGSVCQGVVYKGKGAQGSCPFSEAKVPQTQIQIITKMFSQLYFNKVKKFLINDLFYFIFLISFDNIPSLYFLITFIYYYLHISFIKEMSSLL